MGLRITPLGTRGWIPMEGRQTMCFLVQIDDKDFLFDCGTGIARFTSPEVKYLLGDGPLNIILSHFHLDHFVGLTYLSGLFSPEKRIRLIGPGKGIIEHGVKEACRYLGNPPIFGTPFAKWELDLEIVEIKSLRFDVEGVSFCAMEQNHKGGAISLRLGNQICYVTDAEPSRETSRFARGVKYLLHEAYSVEPGQHGIYHCNLEDAIDAGTEAEVQFLVPVHFGPSVAEKDISTINQGDAGGAHITVPREAFPLPTEL